MFGVTCLDTLFMETVCQRFMPCMHQNAPRDPQIPPDAKTQVQCNVPRRAIYGN
jgi:hypothetical protein